MSGSVPNCSTEISCSNLVFAFDNVIFTLPSRFASFVFSVKNRRRSPFPVPIFFDKVNHSLSVPTTSAVQSPEAVTLMVKDPSVLVSLTSCLDNSNLSANITPFWSSSELHAPNNPINNMIKNVLIFTFIIRLYIII